MFDIFYSYYRKHLFCCGNKPCVGDRTPLWVNRNEASKPAFLLRDQPLLPFFLLTPLPGDPLQQLLRPVPVLVAHNSHMVIRDKILIRLPFILFRLMRQVIHSDGFLHQYIAAVFFIP